MSRFQQQQRDELFAGAGPARQHPGESAARTVDTMDNKEVMQLAVKTHQETTATYHRGLQAMEEAVEVQAKTIAVLHDQGRQMDAIHQDFDRIGKDISYSERILRFMRMCCLCGFCCSCFTEPEAPSNDRDWRGVGRSNERYVPGAAENKARVEQAQLVSDYQRKDDQNRGRFGPDTSAVAQLGYTYEARAIDEESRKQEEYLDKIGMHLDVLKAGALDMRTEVERQTDYMSTMRDDAEELNAKIHNVNTKTQLAEFAPKKKASKLKSPF